MRTHYTISHKIRLALILAVIIALIGCAVNMEVAQVVSPEAQQALLTISSYRL